ncbi:DEAD/DEAH box helicase [Rhizobium leguminosarum]|uniref:DEAD/DEAH box helicase n=1 Tax=Rhizobium leguminosarum TaxID=384 RepID=UPI001441D972|nr:DEAD/DEAH box helicase [Rhizobium leguminosarum bv. viciae]
MVKQASYHILAMLGNERTGELAVQRRMIVRDVTAGGIFTQMARERLRSENTLFSRGRIIVGNSFQYTFWDAVNSDAKFVTVSAPTSAGKSFISLEWLYDYLDRISVCNIVYIAPTRALVSEISREILNRSIITDSENVSVYTMPLREYFSDDAKNVFVLTQERTQILLREIPDDLTVDLVIVDEAHKISDSARGALLEEVVETIASRATLKKAIFLSPQIENPEDLVVGNNDRDSVKRVISDEVLVPQNLFYVNQVPLQSREFTINFMHDLIGGEFKRITLPEKPSNVVKKMAIVSYAIGGGERGNLIYANRPSDAEKIAKLISQFLPSNGDPNPLNQLSELCRAAVHEKFLLANLVTKGCGYHFGNMPDIVRENVEAAFANGSIKFLACTSTLIEGVNLACKNLFVRGPRKGVSTPMPESDFWNLAGRTGRWGKDFAGNIYCIDSDDKSVWKEGVPRRRTKISVTPTFSSVLRGKDTFMEYLASNLEVVDSKRQSEFEHVASCLISSRVSGRPLSSLHSFSKLDAVYQAEATTALDRICEQINLPPALLQRQTGISPIKLQRLYDLFASNSERIEAFAVPDPSGSHSFQEYSDLLYRINDIFGPVFGFGRQPSKIAPIIVKWMSGLPLNRIIGDELKYQGPEADAQAIIRNILGIVEEYARFKAPKYIAAYSDVLHVYLEHEHPEKVGLVDRDIGLYLEFGVSSRTLITLMGLGLSRTSAVALYDEIVFSDLDREGVRTWLQSHPLESLRLPSLVKSEIEQKLFGQPSE